MKKIKLTQKERTLLEDQKSHEAICIQKYNNYAQQAHDMELAKLFTGYAAQEQNHLDTINQMLSGNIPNIQQQSTDEQSPQSRHSYQNQQQQAGQTTGMQNEADAGLCIDMLMTEKYVSDTYDTAIFEFTDSNARQVLNHIQKEEQQHGEGIFNYMQSKGMYNPQ